MVCIHNKLNNSLSKKISAQQIWDKLSSMYDLQALVSVSDYVKWEDLSYI